MKLYKIKKRVVKRLIAFLLTLFITAGSVIGCPAVPAHAAALPAIPALVNYVLTVMGAVSVTDNIVGKVTGDSIITRLSDAISTCLGDGSIYVSADGDYVFNSDSTAAIYEALLDDDSIDAKVISSFPSWNTVIDNSYVNQQFISDIESLKLLYSNYLLVFRQNSNVSGSYFYTVCYAYDISNVSYLWLTDSSVSSPAGRRYTPQFMVDRSGFRAPFAFARVDWHLANGTAEFDNTNTLSENSLTYNPMLFSSFPSFSSDSIANTISKDDVFNSFPVFSDFPVLGNSSNVASNVDVLYYANRSFVISKDAASGVDLSGKDSGVVYNNYYDIFPSVSQTVIEDNNWENIYTSYVNEVNTEYQVSYNENGSVDADELRAILKSVGDRIAEIIEDAGGEIIENLDDIMTWLSRIYDRLGLIESGLSGTGTDLTTVEAYLDSIESLISSCATDLDRLQQIYVLLGQILVAINARGGGGDIVVGLPDVSNTDVLEYITKAQVLASLLETVMPFCFVAMFGTLLNQIGVQPVTPVYHVPFTMHNTFVDIDEEVVLDFSIMQDFRDIMYHVWCISFDILLVWLTFYLLGRVDEILF